MNNLVGIFLDGPNTSSFHKLRYHVMQNPRAGSRKGGRRGFIPGRIVFLGVKYPEKAKKKNNRQNFFKLVASDGRILLYFPGC